MLLPNSLEDNPLSYHLQNLRSLKQSGFFGFTSVVLDEGYPVYFIDPRKTVNLSCIYKRK